jgi:hypothetical protein
MPAKIINRFSGPRKRLRCQSLPKAADGQAGSALSILALNWQ